MTGRRLDEGETAGRHRPKHAAIDFRVVGIGASAGGLEACTKLLVALPADCGMAFILVQHVDPNHPSLLVELLAAHTSLAVRQAAHGMLVERDHLYIIPPGNYLAVGRGALHLTPAPSHPAARMPFDFLLQSMAHEYHGRAVCVVLSGTGSDGALGLMAIVQQGGLVVVQEPADARYDGMPRSAIDTGAADWVVPAAEIPALLSNGVQADGATDGLAAIVDLLRARTPHDFTLYKPGTLQRRIERRMAIASLAPGDIGQYVATLNKDPAELARLAKDLLIHVTGFFRDPKVFDLLGEKTIPELVQACAPDAQIRVWVAGCSTGEEAYSLAMLFHEQMAKLHSHAKLQVFASDVDAEAVATAREGLYPRAIETQISPARLARYFHKEEEDYRISPELRAMVVFTVQDVLTDPPFSRLDLVSCRNFLIYLSPQAQRRVVALFHFALKPAGLLLLGSSEIVDDAADRFELMSKAARLYRHIGRSRPGDVDFARTAGASVRLPAGQAQQGGGPRPNELADLCRSHALATHGPATVLSNLKHEYLYSLGPTDRYLRIPPGHATLDILAMVGDELRPRLRAAMQRAVQAAGPVTVTGGRTMVDGKPRPFRVEVHPVRGGDDAQLLMIYFIDEAGRPVARGVTATETTRVAELELELEETRTDLLAAVHKLEVASDEQKSINENALSVSEEFQSTKEELLTSKEELQSLNEELSALNNQLQATLERSRTMSDDLQNVLYSTNVATLFLDAALNIRFFTPKTKALFSVIKTDIGRPLADLHSMAADGTLAEDAHAVLRGAAFREREIETHDAVWTRRVMPYRTHHNATEGVVITFSEITERKLAAEALVDAKQDAELANVAKSRFLAAASHDLRQPMQTLALLQGLLATRLAGTPSEELVTRLDDTLAAMSGMLNTLLDINQIEAGVVQPEIVDFPLDPLLIRLKQEFAYHAQAQGLRLRVVTAGLTVRSDPRLLEQMLRNLLSNALKYTETGKVLLGCRRNGSVLGIEVWDTGVGIPGTELQAIFEEYHQLANAARERSRGLGLGLSIVQRLGALLGHRVRVRSRPGKGSGFSVDVPFLPAEPVPRALAAPTGRDATATPPVSTVLVVEDEPGVREVLELLLHDRGYHVVCAADGPAAVRITTNGALRPDLVLTDYNLPNGMDGLQVIQTLRLKLDRKLPAIVLTGDIATDTLAAIAHQKCHQLNKPVRPAELMQAIRDLLPPPPAPGIPPPADPKRRTVFVVDDDGNVRDAVRTLLEEHSLAVETFNASESFLESYKTGSEGCLLVDAYLPGMSGLDLVKHLRASGDVLPAIVITGNSDVPMAVQAMKAGASDFIEKPICAADLLASIQQALSVAHDTGRLKQWRDSAAEHIAELTPRQHQVMEMVLAGHPSKNIAADLGISQRTVENHRAAIMEKTGARSLPALARLAMAATGATPI